MELIMSKKNPRKMSNKLYKTQIKKYNEKPLKSGQSNPILESNCYYQHPGKSWNLVFNMKATIQSLGLRLRGNKVTIFTAIALPLSFIIQLGLIFAIICIYSVNINAAVNESSVEKPKVIFTAAFKPSNLRPGENTRLEIKVNLNAGWHIYSLIAAKDEDAPPPTIVEIYSAGLQPDGPTYETRPVKEYIEGLQINIAYHQTTAYFFQNFLPIEKHTKAPYTCNIKIQYQLCTDKICLPTGTSKLIATFTTEPGEARPEFQIVDRSIDTYPIANRSQAVSGLISDGFWAFIALAALMGFVSLLTPCVFPMIPITVSYFSKQAEGRSSRVIKLAALFAAGIIITYTGIGLIFSFFFGAGSALLFASNPTVNLLIAAVFIIFAFSLMGVFQIRLPASIEAHFDQKARSAGGAAGVLLMGFTFTLTAFTCTVQFVGTMLIAAAQGEWMWPLLGMFVFSTVFAFPFFLLAIAPSLIRKLQGKAGDWMGRSKVVLGILELIASTKFLSNADLVLQTGLLSRNRAIAIWMALTGIIVVYLIYTAIKPQLKRSVIQWSIILFFVAIAVWLGKGWNDVSLGSLIDAVLPPPSGQYLNADDFVSPEEVKNTRWLNSLDEALVLSRKENKHIFLEFTGYTCVNCRWMEQNILARKDIHQQLIQNYILVRLFTDERNSVVNNLQLQIDRFNTVALPYYVILSPENVPIRDFSGISLKPADFLLFLQK